MTRMDKEALKRMAKGIKDMQRILDRTEARIAQLEAAAISKTQIGK